MKIKGLLIYIFLLCTVWPAELLAQMDRHTLRWDGETRVYYVHVPEGYSPGTEYPLVINMHGFGSNAAEQSAYTLYNPIADFNQFIVVYPEGLEATLPTLGTGAHWNAYFNTEIDDLGFLDRMIDVIWNNYSVNLEKVYATGMSNGGFMSYTLACELSDRIAAIASVTGSMVPPAFNICDPERKVPVLQFHGTEDQVVPYEGSEISAPISDVMTFWAQQHGCDNEAVMEELPDTEINDNSTATRFTYQNCDEDGKVILYRINNGGHIWPGGFVNLPALGATNRDIVASTLIWDFLQQYSHPNHRDPMVITSLDSPESESQVYPTLVHKKLHVVTKESMVLQITDLNGRMQLIMQLTAGQHEVNLNPLSPGFYIVKLSGKSVQTQKIRKLSAE